MVTTNQKTSGANFTTINSDPKQCQYNITSTPPTSNSFCVTGLETTNNGDEIQAFLMDVLHSGYKTRYKMSTTSELQPWWLECCRHGPGRAHSSLATLEVTEYIEITGRYWVQIPAGAALSSWSGLAWSGLAGRAGTPHAGAERLLCRMAPSSGSGSFLLRHPLKQLTASGMADTHSADMELMRAKAMTNCHDSFPMPLYTATTASVTTMVMATNTFDVWKNLRMCLASMVDSRLTRKPSPTMTPWLRRRILVISFCCQKPYSSSL